jgi:hypothetical protein
MSIPKPKFTLNSLKKSILSSGAHEIFIAWDSKLLCGQLMALVTSHLPPKCTQPCANVVSVCSAAARGCGSPTQRRAFQGGTLRHKWDVFLSQSGSREIYSWIIGNRKSPYLGPYILPHFWTYSKIVNHVFFTWSQNIMINVLCCFFIIMDRSIHKTFGIGQDLCIQKKWVLFQPICKTILRLKNKCL